MQRACRRQAARRAKRQRRPLVHLSVAPLKTVPSSNSRTSLTSRCRLPAIISSMPGTSDGRSMPASSLSGLPSGTTSPGCGAVRARILCRKQNVLRDRLMKSRRQQRPPHAASFSAASAARAPPCKRRQRVGKPVVAVDARNFFNQIDLALQIEPPARQRHLPALRACCTAVQLTRSPDAVSTPSTVAAVIPSGSTVVPSIRCTSLSASATGSRFAVRASICGNDAHRPARPQYSRRFAE